MSGERSSINPTADYDTVVPRCVWPVHEALKVALAWTKDTVVASRWIVYGGESRMDESLGGKGRCVQREVNIESPEFDVARDLGRKSSRCGDS